MAVPLPTAAGRGRDRSRPSDAFAAGLPEGAKDRGRAGGALLCRAERWQEGRHAEDDADWPGRVDRRGGGKGGEHEGQRDTHGRAPRPRAQPHELRSMAMLFDGHEHAGGSEHSTPYLEVPAVIVAPSPYDGVVCAQRPLEGPEPRLVRVPLFGPDPERARPGKCELRHATPPPGREAAGQTATQA